MEEKRGPIRKKMYLIRLLENIYLKSLYYKELFCTFAKN